MEYAEWKCEFVNNVNRGLVPYWKVNAHGCGKTIQFSSDKLTLVKGKVTAV